MKYLNEHIFTFTIFRKDMKIYKNLTEKILTFTTGTFSHYTCHRPKPLMPESRPTLLQGSGIDHGQLWFTDLSL